MSNKKYLGDSVYVEEEDGMIKLTTNNGFLDDPRNVIYMNDQIFEAFMKFIIDQGMIDEETLYDILH